MADISSHSKLQAAMATQTSANTTITIALARNDSADKCTSQHGDDKEVPKRKQNCMVVSFPMLVLIALIMISVVLGRQYIKDVLIYIDTLGLWESVVLFAVMYTIVAFPIMWGYILLLISCGYTYGFWKGAVMASGCTLYAILCAHFIIRRFFKVVIRYLYSMLNSFLILVTSIFYATLI